MKTAEEIRIELKHEEHSGALDHLIEELDGLLTSSKEFSGPEDLYRFLRLNTEAALFLLKERRRDRKRRELELMTQVSEKPKNQP